ncbi:sulfate reduction electron transfer complex DsrMKJOP subunit DsrO [Desulfosarcina ovata]|uniref:4Fe-4S ferredoxin n=1 Tax=Desulfosarcina ovata subsp. ovata TaxID=2752305 RepID=A0A5K8A9P3_9BACT|nr:4Fe-4S dicluster domain-containing protein [Desulfosarcina ovata]BBO89221.1 4Fe-4S ferredoxin [Desulfosarcina ovata subsp. ovata]
MKNSRRRFLQIAGVSALGLGAKPVLNAFASGGAEGPGYHVAKGEDARSAKQWAMVIDTRKLQTAEALEPIIEACNKIHNIPTGIENKNHEIKWIWETHYHNAFTDKASSFLDEAVENRPFLLLCNHCENPPCVRACPTKATFKNENGIVMMDFHRCIGCRFCMAACPFGARSFNFRDPRPFIKETNKEFPTRMKGVVEKCNFCAERLAVGKQPACVEASNGAIAFGDLYDEHSEVRELLKENYTIRRKQTLGTEPAVYYIV